MGRYCDKNGPAKAARHFSQLLDSKLPQDSEALRRSGYIIYWLRDRMAKFKIRQFKYNVMAKIAKFNAHYIFPLHGMGKTEKKNLHSHHSYTIQQTVFN